MTVIWNYISTLMYTNLCDDMDCSTRYGELVMSVSVKEL